MKLFTLLTTLLLSLHLFAEHDKTYCGQMLPAESGKDFYSKEHPEAILAVEYAIVDGEVLDWDEGYAALYALDKEDYEFTLKAVRGSLKRGTYFCVKARWGGAAYSSWDINAISLLTDNVERIDYMSRFYTNEY